MQLRARSNSNDPNNDSKTLEKERPITVLSFDADGCLFSPEYIAYYSKKKFKSESQIPLFKYEKDDPLFSANIALFDKVKKDCAKEICAEVHLFLGSARQSELGDFYSCTPPRGTGEVKTESAYSALTKIHKKISKEVEVPCILNKLLLSDLWNNQKSVTEKKQISRFDRILANIPLRNKDYSPEASSFIQDTSKVILLYTQIHETASKHPNTPIIFYFYDDVSYIIEALYEVFTTYPQMLPKNVTLSVNEYNGTFPTQQTEFSKNIIGAGEIDFNYANNILEIFIRKLAKDNNRTTPLKEIFNERFDISEAISRCSCWEKYLSKRTLKNTESVSVALIQTSLTTQLTLSKRLPHPPFYNAPPRLLTLKILLQ